MTHVILTALLLLPTSLPDSDKQPTVAEALKSIRQERQKIEEKYSKLFDERKTDKEKADLYKERRKEIHACVRRALELARAHLGDPAAFDALEWIITGGLGYFQETWDALYLIQRDYTADKRVGKVCLHASIYRLLYPGTERLLRTVLEKNPDHAVQGAACFTLARVLEDYARMVRGFKDPVKAKTWEQGYPRDLVQDLKTRDPDKLQSEAESLYQRTIDQFGDVTTPGWKLTLGQRATSSLFELHHLQVGKQAPEIEGEDIDGKKFRLSDYRGKVVVLDFWGHW
jgi:hypothetical protein